MLEGASGDSKSKEEFRLSIERSPCWGGAEPLRTNKSRQAKVMGGWGVLASGEEGHLSTEMWKEYCACEQ